jgi:hypothetical protein
MTAMMKMEDKVVCNADNRKTRTQSERQRKRGCGIISKLWKRERARVDWILARAARLHRIWRYELMSLASVVVPKEYMVVVNVTFCLKQSYNTYNT